MGEDVSADEQEDYLEKKIEDAKEKVRSGYKCMHKVWLGHWDSMIRRCAICGIEFK